MIGYFISAFTLGLGFLWVIINQRRHDWADKLAVPSVVYAGTPVPMRRFCRIGVTEPACWRADDRLRRGTGLVRAIRFRVAVQ